ncbi:MULTISPECIES: GNAT family N-acetyltransferase [Bacillus cereus group]|uniref:GNAT family N-acetyltransferase n=2 Tax=Bacillus cereus group TaxID=86661 RepID=A0A643MCI7_BACTU|nr:MULTISPECIES: GNAT family N-acetyltransferase [Bacillus cereus group]AGE79186.1 acetyltransferase, GNAT [Bacillus thuringiensis serovar kurstaki str. HD73]AHZ52181.1 ribosomal-protein-alanine acetyltransferase [Bacillus thuringiensis serovar kurstaki str. YBT-1520]AIE34602.1 ribosomal-protein-alanine acetyltransferase [Bacillus thuringiensis serovar kurstaki str. HD-1]AIM31043.1 acetyltransferase, GNAT [Bacillus thuringiensis serovar kurstaki str. YBT-1520]AJK43802.1 acetyltransferase famil
MILKLNSTSFEVATSILQVQIPAYKVEAGYLNSTAIPRLYDTVNDIQNCVETFYGYFSENKLVGFISFVQEEKLIDIHRLVVSPDFFQKGIATKLLIYIFNMFPSSMTYIVQTGKANTPAITLYKKHGFITVSDTILPDGMILTQLKKTEYTK